jgi:hypothetical protein
MVMQIKIIVCDQRTLTLVRHHPLLKIMMVMNMREEVVVVVEEDGILLVVTMMEVVISIPVVNGQEGVLNKANITIRIRRLIFGMMLVHLHLCQCLIYQISQKWH